LPDGSQGSLERIDHENGRIEIRAKHPHSEETVSHWLHFHKDVEVTDSEGKRKKCRVAIAYQLEKVTEKNKNSENWKIIPIQGGGQVSIYFPAEKETSKLRFHIHAPFASTVARDSVRDCDDNKQLRDHLAELITESLSVIRDQKMLVMSFLAVLPNAKDELAEFYERIREKIVHQFRYSPLTPTKSGSYSYAYSLYRSSPSAISNLINDQDLKLLVNKSPTYTDNNAQVLMNIMANDTVWVANAPQRNQREDNFLDSLGIKTWSFEQLSEIFASANREKTESWIETKDDDWLRRFYILLKEAKQHHEDNNYQPWEGKKFPLVRINSEEGVKHVLGNQAYFESSLQGHIFSDGINTVKPNVYSKNIAKREIDANAKAFLESIGVRPFDEKAAIELRLKFYHSTPPKNITDHYFNDIKQFVRYWKENAKEGSYYKRQADELFKQKKFLISYADESLLWNTVEEICMDGPIYKTGLSEFINIHRKNPISDKYEKKLTKDEVTDFTEFLISLGAMHDLQITELEHDKAIKNPNNPYNPHYHNWTYTGYAKDFSIQHLEKYLNTKKISASKLIWNAITLSNSLDDVKKARFYPNQRHPVKVVESQLLYYLKNNTWIPNKEQSAFYTPSEITSKELPDDFRVNYNNGLLVAIEFGKKAKDLEDKVKELQAQATASFKEKEKRAKDSGFESHEEMKAAAQLIKDAKAQGKTLTEISAILNPKKPDFEADYSSNPARRANKVQETATDAPEKRSILKMRSVAVDTETKKAAKSYLLDRYTDDDKILYCQVCQNEMPFKLSDGNYYFEVVQLISNTQKRHKENYIALCPTDAAKFQYANSSKDKIAELVEELIDDRSVEEINDSDDDENKFEIVLAGNDETVQFRRVHLIDLKAILELGHDEY
jgi:hypothetical protein